jgi:hypothetical protein
MVARHDGIARIGEIGLGSLRSCVEQQWDFVQGRS